MAKTEPYLTQAERAELVNWLIEGGKNYDSYLGFCTKFGIPASRQWTKKYFTLWCHRHRKSLQVQEERRLSVLRRGSSWDREKRLRTLEDTLERLEIAIAILMKEKPLDVGKLVRAEEQKRRTVEQIAKERGEWDTRGDRRDDRLPSPVAQEMSLAFQRYFNRSKKAMPEAVVVEDGEE
jgi:hypothetical protein